MDRDALDLIASTALEGIQAMAVGQPMAVVLVLSPLQPHLELRHQLFSCTSNLVGDGQTREVLELALEALERKATPTVGSA